MALLGHVPVQVGSVASDLGVGNERRWTLVRQYLDLRVHDRVALDEIELYAEMLSAVAAAKRPLTVAEIDMVLGVRSDEAGRRELMPRD
ncbi:hypothetical protein BZB76_5572 [Actinomadura pelletieri DSM 43383]|uniref:Uncharacterized protein n=1 Tax=Actinomadura pelletieri DSM 43383 TaxID=1120940 RepID=A0A495QGP1_9ACTN|nr:hypothetical protein BZB76_5572 [Actinomadura pelletieri DSM 43383]